DFAVGFGLGVGFLILSLVVIDDCVGVSVVIAVVVGFAVVATDVVVGLGVGLFGLVVNVVGCFLASLFEHRHHYPKLMMMMMIVMMLHRR
ncbi:unnamed protein product, partial [Rotaria magnacalcarata]